MSCSSVRRYVPSRSKLRGARELLIRRRRLAALRERRPEVVPCPLVGEIERRRAFQCGDCIAGFALQQVRISEVVPGVRSHRQRSGNDPELRHRLVEPTLRRIGGAQRVVSVDKAAIDGERLAVRVDRLVRPVLSVVETTELIVAVGPLARARHIGDRFHRQWRHGRLRCARKQQTGAA